MVNIHVVAKERHAGKRWQRYTSYAHTAANAVAHLIVPELSRACVAMPIGFIEVKGGLAPVAIQGLEPGTNLFVAEDGRWLADYIPAAYRSYPFALGTTDEGKPVLCVLEDSGLLSDTTGELFFDEHGEQAPFLNEVLDFLTQVAVQRNATQRICSVLQKHKLVQPWPFKRKTAEGEQVIEGLLRIDQAALKQLSAEAFQEIRMAGALPVIYCQLLSVQHLPKLHQLARSRTANRGALPLAPEGDLDIEFLNKGGTISFGQFDYTLMRDRGGY